jgi:hypothetical protein
MNKKDGAGPLFEPDESHKMNKGFITNGLTKYEHFLGLAFQAIISSQPKQGYISPEKISCMAIEYTDRLFNTVNYGPEKNEL